MSYSNNVREIAREYFTDILYIDDALKPPVGLPDNVVALSQQAATATAITTDQVYKRPPKSIRPKEDSTTFQVPINIAPSNPSSFTNAYKLLLDFQKIGCKASPYFYENTESNTTAMTLIERSHLTILDWHLNEVHSETALSLIKNILHNVNRLKIVVIYTAHPDEAVKDLITEFPDTQIKVDKTSDSREYHFTHLPGALIVICDRKIFDANTIRETIIDLVLMIYGVFPLAFFQSINQINKETASILKKFSHPFADYLLLQLHSSDLGLIDFPTSVGEMVSTHINKVIDINQEIFIDIIEQWKDVIGKWIQMEDTQLIEMTTNCLQTMINKHLDHGHAKHNKEFLELMMSLPSIEWRSFLNLVLEYLNEKNYKKCKKAILNISNAIMKLKIKSECQKIAELNSLPDTHPIKKSYTSIIKKSYKDSLDNISEKLIPSILIYMIASQRKEIQLTNSLIELIYLMKIHSYDVDKSCLSCIENMHEDSFNNFFHNGDILYKSNQREEFLLCISPKCDVFRPHKKIYNQLKFVIGKRLENDINLPERLKESEKLTILPDPLPNSNKLICIKWEYYNTKVIPINNLKDYMRPYRLNHSYAQQIVNHYIAYHSRAGVEELFFKENHNMRNFYIFNK